MTIVEERDCRDERTCIRCGYRVAMPYTKRCPRCLTPLAAAEEPVCGGCIQAAGCLTAQSSPRLTSRRSAY
jgi:hypothetical protein